MNERGLTVIDVAGGPKDSHGDSVAWWEAKAGTGGEHRGVAT
jgi:hypothetical protein